MTALPNSPIALADAVAAEYASVPFTAAHAAMLTEIHAAITSIADTVQNLPLAQIGKSPIGRMLGLG